MRWSRRVFTASTYGTVSIGHVEPGDSIDAGFLAQVGALQFGMSFRASERLTLSSSVDVGVTEDAPDVRVSFRTPFRC